MQFFCPRNLHGIRANLSLMAKTVATEERRSSASSKAESSNTSEPYRTTMNHGGHSSHILFQLTLHKLNGKNYLESAQSMKLAIDGKGKIMLYMLASGAAAGFAVTVDFQNNFFSYEVFSRFYDKSSVSASILLLAFLCSAVLSVHSAYALQKKESETSN